MVIASLVILTLPKLVQQVLAGIAEVDGLSVHEVVDGYKIVALIEAADLDEAYEISERKLRAVPGVIGVNLAQIHYEPERAGEETVIGAREAEEPVH